MSEILTHSTITNHLESVGILQSNIGTNKSDRIFYSLKERERQNSDLCGNYVLLFVTKIISPKRYSTEDSFENDRQIINEKLAFHGIEIDKSGQARKVTAARTISAAKERLLKVSVLASTYLNDYLY